MIFDAHHQAARVGLAFDLRRLGRLQHQRLHRQHVMTGAQRGQDRLEVDVVGHRDGGDAAHGAYDVDRR